MSARLLLAVVLALGLVAAAGCAPAAPDADALARAAAERFLTAYVDPDGRVVRRDEGGDTVSEGQSYALLLAVAVGDAGAFDRVWTWTRDRLRGADGLLAWRWADGAVADPMPAADADLNTAWALALAAERFDRPDLAQAADELAAAMAAQTLPGPVLAAGPWAVEADPPVVNPSYWALPALAALPGVRDQAGPARALLAGLVDGGARLPADWAALPAPGAAAEPIAAPFAPERGVRYGLDAARAVVWLATDCAADGRALAAALWPLLRGPAGSQLASSLDGAPLERVEHPAMVVAAAAAAGAAGDGDERARLLARAERLAAAFPTYYGDAWLALGRVLLTTTLLPTCPTEDAP